MVLWMIIQMSILSLIFILLVHHLLYFFKNSLTVPKVNDLIISPTKKYEKMFHVISSNKVKVNNITDKNCINGTTNINEIANNDYFIKENENIENILVTPSLNNNMDNTEKKTMKQDLMMFLKKQINSTTEEIQPYQNQNLM